MRSALIIASLLVLIPSWSAAQDNPMKPDGRMWETMTNMGAQASLLKEAYVQGATEGLQEGAVTGYVTGRTDEKGDALTYIKPCIERGRAGIPPASMMKPVESSRNDIIAGAVKVRDGLVPRSLSILDIVHQMDKFYADYKNTPVCMIQAVKESISSLRGEASSEENLQAERKGCNP